MYCLNIGGNGRVYGVVAAINRSHIVSKLNNLNMENELSKTEQPCTIHSVSSRLSSADQEELQKCKDSPVYFYNKYVRKEGQKEYTEAEYNDFVKQVEYQRNMPLKLRKHYKDRPLLPSECYEKPPDFLKNGC